MNVADVTAAGHAAGWRPLTRQAANRRHVGNKAALARRLPKVSTRSTGDTDPPMRTHPAIALAVIATAITTVTVFGQSVPPAPALGVRKPHRAEPSPAARVPAPVASTAVPAWLAAPAASDPEAPRAEAPHER